MSSRLLFLLSGELLSTVMDRIFLTFLCLIAGVSIALAGKWVCARALKQKNIQYFLIKRSRIKFIENFVPAAFFLESERGQGWWGQGLQSGVGLIVSCLIPGPWSVLKGLPEGGWGLKIIWKMVQHLFFKWLTVDVAGMTTPSVSSRRQIYCAVLACNMTFKILRELWHDQKESTLSAVV